MSDEKKPILQVLHSSIVLIRLLVCSFCWLTNTFVYYGLSLNSVAFAGDKYTNFMLVAVVEIPAYMLTWLLTDRVGRKPTLSGSFLLSGAFCLAIQFVPTGKKRPAFHYRPLVRKAIEITPIAGHRPAAIHIGDRDRYISRRISKDLGIASGTMRAITASISIRGG